MVDANKDDTKDRWVDVLIAMHNYNDVSGKHHDESVRRSASVFVVVYFFLLGVTTTTGLNIISLVASILLSLFARVGYNLALTHSAIAGMHYWRNQQIRIELDSIRKSTSTSLAEIFAKSRTAYSESYNLDGKWTYGYGDHRKSWARIHNIFVVVGVIVAILAGVNQLSCFGKNGCMWSKGNDTTESLSSSIKEFIRKTFPGT